MPSPSPDAPPPGGFGGGGSGGPGFGPAPAPAGARAGLTGLVVAMTVIAMVGTLLVLAIVGLRKYLATAKTGEAKNTLGQLAKDAVIAYERELPDAAPSQATHGSLCPSASRPVPLETSSIRGRKYQSTAAEWSVDEARDAGFACLRFELMAPQYYQVIYEASPTSFTGTTRGDLDGDGQLSTFTLGGEVHGGRLWLAPTIREVDPDE